MADVKEWITGAEKQGWRVLNKTTLEIRLVCAKHGCTGRMAVPLANPGPIPDPCPLDHVAAWSSGAFDDYKALVAIFIKRRHALGLSQEDLNDVLGMADGYISKLESFARVSTLPTLQLWAQCLGLSIVTGRAPLPPATAAAIQRRTTSPYRPEMSRSKHVRR